MKITVMQHVPYDPFKVSARCPHCGKEATFDPVGVNDISLSGVYVCGQRQCPDPKCKGHIFVVIEKGIITKTYPSARIPIDKDNIPPDIIKSFEEALDCYTIDCFVASALMVRRTLEELCADKQAGGDNLKERIKNLRSKIVVPSELLDAMDELRLLGNDAAHIESQTFDKITKEEVSVAIEFTKEILKSVYQYASLLDKLRSLKKK